MLINAGADILKEDIHGRMALCYAIISPIKFSHSEEVFQELLDNLGKRSLLKKYLESRIELIKFTAINLDFSNSTSDMFLKIIQFAVSHIEGSIQIFLDCSVFQQLLEVI